MVSGNGAGERQELPIVPQIVNDLEVLVTELECWLLDALTPAQFERVQELIQATRIVTTARCVLGEQERRELEARTTNCGWRPRHLARRRHRLVEMTVVAPSEARRS